MPPGVLPWRSLPGYNLPVGRDFPAPCPGVFSKSVNLFSWQRRGSGPGRRPDQLRKTPFVFTGKTLARIYNTWGLQCL